jgi:DNA processing protein
MGVEGPSRSAALAGWGAGPFLFDGPRERWTRYTVDVQTAVSVSMLSVARARASAAFNEIRHQGAGDPLAAVLEACEVPRGAWPTMIAEARERAARALREAGTAGAEPVSIFDYRYPPLLGCIPDPPPVLWVRGDVEQLARPAVAVVGSRAATPYALEVAGRLGEELGSRGMVVVSGLARGVDSAAHRGCLASEGSTAAILGSGVDRIYPHEHDELAVSITARGVLASELGPGAAPLPEHFPLRNRIISGISLAVVVVEASERSGSLITARCALEQGRDVMAVPGSILSGRNRGSHGLLKDGAKVVETADDILEELGWPLSPPREGSEPKSLISDPLLAVMAPGEVYRLDELVALSGVAGHRLLPRLTELELNGLIAGMGTGGYARVSRPRC